MVMEGKIRLWSPKKGRKGQGTNVTVETVTL